MGKAREFWIDMNPSFPGPFNSDLRQYDAYNREMPQRVIPQCHVIEKSAYDKAVAALKEIKDNRNPCDFYEFIYPLVCKTLRELEELNVQE